MFQKHPTVQQTVFCFISFSLALAACGGAEQLPKTDAAAPPSARADAPTVVFSPDTSPDRILPTESQPDTETVAPDLYNRDSAQAMETNTAPDTAIVADIKLTLFADAAMEVAKQDSVSLSDKPLASPDSPLVIDSPLDLADLAIRNSDVAVDQPGDIALADSKDAGCITGTIRESYTGPANTNGVGPCRSKIEKCNQSGVFTIERQEIPPIPETAWDGTDQDCNGSDLTCPIYVKADAADTGVENGAPTSPWKTIQAAINNLAACDTIIVKPGTYREQILCSFSTARVIKSEKGAGVTIIDRSNSTEEPIGIRLDHCSITLEGFTIANAADTGIHIFSVPYTTIIQRNILLHNSTGISVDYGPGDNEQIIIRNNIIISAPDQIISAYDGTGIHLRQHGGGRRRVENNLMIGNHHTNDTSAGVFIDNWSNGYVENNIILDGYNGIILYYDYNTTISRYNCLFGNHINYAKFEGAGMGDITADPMFTGAIDGGVGATTDFHLAPDSPCRNAGNPDPAFNDADGTRNDIGPYGGPFGVW